jgi:hypothetical protein
MDVNTLIALAFMFLSMAPPAYGMLYSSVALRRKGFASPLIQQLIIWSYLGTWIAVWFGVAFLPPAAYEPDPTSARLLRYAIVGCGICWLMVPAAHGITALLPVKQRVYGARQTRFPYKSVGITLYGLAACASIYGFLDWILNPFPEDGLLQGMRLVAALVPGGTYFLYLDRRASETTLERVVASDKRPPVLYLRSCHEEDLPFVEMPSREMRAYTYLTLYDG